MRLSNFPFYYGWLVLAAGAVTELLAQGATSYAAGLFVLPLQAEFHISRANANSAVLILFFGAALAAPLVGRLLDRFSMRLVITCGALLFSLSFIGIALASSLWVMTAILLVPAAIGFMAIGPLTTSTLASRWFRQHRGLAMGLAAVATSGGGLVVVPLLSLAIQRYGWRPALQYEAVAISLLVIPLALLLIRDTPSELSLADHPENQASGVESPVSGTAIGKWQVIFTGRAFWIPALVLAASSGISQAVVVTLVPYGVALGIAAPMAALFISAFAMSSAVTKVLAGVMADHISQGLLLTAAMAFMMLSMLALYFTSGTWSLLAGACFAGISLGCALPTVGALIAASFGAASFGTVMGAVYTLVLLSAIAATRFVGAVYDSTHGYRAGFAVLFVLAACVMAGTVSPGPGVAAKKNAA
jgi:MFS family permease